MKKLIHKIFFFINILFAISLIISYISVYIDPAIIVLPAFFGLAYPYLLLFNIVFAVIWAVKLRFEALLSIAVIAAGYSHLSNYIRLFKTTSATQGNISVMSYNLRLMNYYENPDDKNTEKKILSLFNSIKPDILCLQELFISGSAEKKDLEIKNSLGKNYNSHLRLMGKGKDKFYGIGTYTRYPIVGRGEIVHLQSSSLSIYTDILIDKDTFRVYNNHLQSFRLKSVEKSFIEELIESENKEALNEIIYISRSLKKGFIQRSMQAVDLKNHINKSPYPVIVVGDFNDTPVSYSYRKIKKDLFDSFVTSGYGAGFTYRGNYPQNRIDYILYDANLKNTGFEIMRTNYSDHYPIIARFRKAY